MFWPVLKCHSGLPVCASTASKDRASSPKKSQFLASEKQRTQIQKISRRHGQKSAAVFVRALVYAGSLRAEGAARVEGDKVSPGFRNSQAIAPRPAAAAATWNPALQPNLSARNGVKDTVIIPPI
jgi:hypothetical protein